MLKEKINELKKALLESSNLAEKMVRESIQGLLKKDENLLEKVMKKKEPMMNESEIKIDRMCTNLIARFQPEASYLRTILMVFRINYELERIGDLAVNISESARFLIKRPEVKPLIDIPMMADISMEMLRDSINSFVDIDTEVAKNVLERDSIVDGLRDQILRELITFMAADPSTIERSIHLIRISRNLERIADLSTNICEDVIFMVEGKIVKHKKDNRI